MTPFTSIHGLAAPLLEDNVDTDIIFPARFLLITAREGLGRYAFHDRRFDATGQERQDFPLNLKQFSKAEILLAGENFGSGSSREQAVWALAGLGLRCIIASSFGEIFHANCFRNGILPIQLPRATIMDLADLAVARHRFTVDLEAQHVAVDGRIIEFAVTPQQRLALLNGWDETVMILETSGADIAMFETKQRLVQPWLWTSE